MSPTWIVVAVALLTTACGGGDTDASLSSAQADAEPTGSVTVFAAASLTDAFGQIAHDFEAAHPAVSVTASFAGSQTLAAQIVQGAPADVFAAANQAQMGVAVEAGRIAGDPETFVSNRLAIVVEPGNPTGIEGLDDLDDPATQVVLAAPVVPAGRYAREALETAGVDVTPVSLEQDVRAVLTKVALGEADAGIVYASDVAAAGDTVAHVDVDVVDVVASYPIAVLSDAPNPATARAFVDYVRSDAGQATLARFGFGAAG